MEQQHNVSNFYAVVIDLAKIIFEIHAMNRCG